MSTTQYFGVVMLCAPYVLVLCSLTMAIGHAHARGIKADARVFALAVVVLGAWMWFGARLVVGP